MSDLQGPPAELRFTVTVTRAATGKTETFEMVGRSLPAEPEQPESQHGGDSQHGSTQRSD
jgi:hypothetical protein